jgi:CRP-like cAMP-binding protein
MAARRKNDHHAGHSKHIAVSGWLVSIASHNVTRCYKWLKQLQGQNVLILPNAEANMTIIQVHPTLSGPIAVQDFGSYPAAHFERHGARSACRKVAAHQLIWAESETRREIYLVRSGAVCFSRMLIDGRRVVTGFAYPGEIIGIGQGVHRNTAEALQCCKLETLSLGAFRQATAKDADFAVLVQDLIFAELERAHAHLMVLSKMTACERLAHFLMGLSDRNRQLGHSPASVLIPMRRIDIADHLGLTIETVSRTFTNFKQAGLIAMDDPTVVFLTNPERLGSMASGAGEEEGGVAIRRRCAA